MKACNCCNVNKPKADYKKKSLICRTCTNVDGSNINCALCKKPFIEQSLKNTIMCNHSFHADCFMKFSQEKTSPAMSVVLIKDKIRKYQADIMNSNVLVCPNCDKKYVFKQTIHGLVLKPIVIQIKWGEMYEYSYYCESLDEYKAVWKLDTDVINDSDITYKFIISDKNKMALVPFNTETPYPSATLTQVCTEFGFIDMAIGIKK